MDQYESVILGRPGLTHNQDGAPKTMAAARTEQLQEEAKTRLWRSPLQEVRRSGGKRKGRGRKKAGTSSRGRGRTAGARRLQQRSGVLESGREGGGAGDKCQWAAWVYPSLAADLAQLALDNIQ